MTYDNPCVARDPAYVYQYCSRRPVSRAIQFSGVLLRNSIACGTITLCGSIRYSYLELNTNTDHRPRVTHGKTTVRCLDLRNLITSKTLEFLTNLNSMLVNNRVFLFKYILYKFKIGLPFTYKNVTQRFLTGMVVFLQT